MNKLISFLLFIFLLSPGITISQNNQWYTFAHGVPEVANRYIYIDKNDVKWIGGYGGGLHKFAKGTWTHYNTTTSGIPNNDVRQSCYDSHKNLWIATWNKLGKFNTDSNTWFSYNVTGQQNDILSSVAVDNQDRIWVGTDGGSDPDDGLYMFNGTTWKFYNPINSPLTGKWISNLKKDRTGKIWGCHYKGLFEINDTVITNHLLIDAGITNSNASTTMIDFDSYNNKWTAVYDGGIAKFDGTNWTTYTSSNSLLPENKVWALAVDLNDNIWIGTENRGLVKFDGTNWTFFNNTNSLIDSNARVDALNVDKLGNLWIGNAYGDSSSILVYNSNGVTGVSGKVFIDWNNNSIQENGEPPVVNHLVTIMPGNLLGVTDTNGEYTCPVLNAGSYSVKPTLLNSHQTGCNPDSINFSINSDTLTLNNQNFGLLISPNVDDLAIDITALTRPRPGFNHAYNITAINAGSKSTDSVYVQLAFDSHLVLDSVSPPYISKQNDTITWYLDSISFLKSTTIHTYFRLPATVPLGTSLISKAAVKSEYFDADTTNNEALALEVTTGSFDPNDKQVTPSGTGASGDISPTTPALTYTIRFQNTGTDTAFNIIVKDTISPSLDLSTIKIISSSNAYSLEIKPGNIVHWKFDNILLPDSNIDEPGSHGYIKYAIKTKPSLPNGTEIKNQAFIYFDFNAPIATNQTLNTINSVVLSNAVLRKNIGLNVFPNPAGSMLRLELSDLNDSTAELCIFNFLGQKTYSHSFTGQWEQIDISSLCNGIYFASVSFKDGRTCGVKFTKTQ